MKECRAKFSSYDAVCWLAGSSRDLTPFSVSRTSTFFVILIFVFLKVPGEANTLILRFALLWLAVATQCAPEIRLGALVVVLLHHELVRLMPPRRGPSSFQIRRFDDSPLCCARCASSFTRNAVAFLSGERGFNSFERLWENGKGTEERPQTENYGE